MADESIEENEVEEEEVEEVEPEEADQETEAKASRMGWVKKEKFRGDDDRWVTAKEFVERGETHLPIMRERLKKLDQTVVGLRETISGMKNTFREFKKYHSETEGRAYKKAVKDLTNKQRIAAEEGDIETFDSIEEEKEALQDEMAEKTNAAIEEEKTLDFEEQEAIGIFEDWKTENKWFDNDKVLQQYAKTLSTEIQEAEGLGGKALYNAVAEDVKERFPEKFKATKRKRATKVDGGGTVPAKTGKKSFANLPKDAQVQCLEFVKEMPGFTKEEYIAYYDWD